MLFKWSPCSTLASWELDHAWHFSQMLRLQSRSLSYYIQVASRHLQRELAKEMAKGRVMRTTNKGIEGCCQEQLTYTYLRPKRGVGQWSPPWTDCSYGVKGPEKVIFALRNIYGPCCLPPQTNKGTHGGLSLDTTWRPRMKPSHVEKTMASLQTGPSEVVQSLSLRNLVSPFPELE